MSFSSWCSLKAFPSFPASFNESELALPSVTTIDVEIEKRRRNLNIELINGGNKIENRKVLSKNNKKKRKIQLSAVISIYLSRGGCWCEGIIPDDAAKWIEKSNQSNLRFALSIRSLQHLLCRHSAFNVQREATTILQKPTSHFMCDDEFPTANFSIYLCNSIAKNVSVMKGKSCGSCDAKNQQILMKKLWI